MLTISEHITEMLASVFNGTKRIEREVRIRSIQEIEADPNGKATVKLTAYSMGEGLARIDVKVR